MKHVGYMTLSFEGDVSFYHNPPKVTGEPVWKLYDELVVNQLEQRLKVYEGALKIISEGDAIKSIAYLALEKGSKL